MSELYSKVAVIIPCFKEKKTILEVISRTLEFPVQIYVVDDGCPESTGNFVSSNWAYKKEKPRPQLIPNFDYKISQFSDFYNSRLNQVVDLYSIGNST